MTDVVVNIRALNEASGEDAAAAAESAVTAGEQAELSQAWAEGTEPGGPGTKSAKTWAGEAQGYAESYNAQALADAVETAERWAEGTLPGGAGTKSSKKWANETAALFAGGYTASDLPATTATGIKALDPATYPAAIRNEAGARSIYTWDATVPVDTHQSDTLELKYLAPDDAAAGAYVRDYESAAMPAFDQIKMRMLTGRVDFVGIGDSNQILSGTGWDHGFQYALSQFAQMYASPLISINEGEGSGAGQGYGVTYNAAGPLVGTITGAPSGLHAYLDKGAGDLNPHEYGYIASGSFAWGDTTGTAVIGALNVLDNTAALVFDFHYGTFDSGSGQFVPAVRLGVSPYSEIVSAASAISTNTGSFSVTRTSLTLPADGTRAGKAIEGRWTKVGTGITAPFFGLWQRIHNPARATGFSYHTLDYRGGQSLRTMAHDLQEMSDTALAYYFGEVRRLQGTLKTVVICVNSALNDRNETLPSVGPGAIADGDSAAAFVDNFKALKARIEEIWDNQGWDQSELFWLLFPSHPVDDPDNAELRSYRSALEAHSFSMERTQFVNIAELTNESEMLSEGWYASGGSDRNHLTQAGYEQIARKVIGAVE